MELETKLKEENQKKMIIDCISDLHGYYPELEGGDLLIVAGDLTATDTPIEYGYFGCWMQRQRYKKKIIISGNHDNFFDRKGFEFIKDIYKSIEVEYLCDSGIVFSYWDDGSPEDELSRYRTLKIWGSPWTAQFPGINPKCCAFTMPFGCDTEEWLNEKWLLIPDDIDILITHSPPHGIFDKVNRTGEHVGSKTLRDHVTKRIKPRLHVFGHIHEHGGKSMDCIMTNFVNASIVNERYEHVNKTIRIEL
jgi:Icc-related predicted phosphoesterase